MRWTMTMLAVAALCPTASTQPIQLPVVDPDPPPGGFEVRLPAGSTRTGPRLRYVVDFDGGPVLKFEYVAPARSDIRDVSQAVGIVLISNNVKVIYNGMDSINLYDYKYDGKVYKVRSVKVTSPDLPKELQPVVTDRRPTA